MSGEWQLRRDIDRFKTFLDNLESDMIARFGEEDNLLDIFYGKADVDGLLRDAKAEMLDLIYPIGSIYMSVNDVDPSVLFGGSWERIGQGRTLIGEGTGVDANNTSKTFTNAETNGEYTHTLSTTEMPSHSHRVSSGWSSAAGTDRITFGQVSGQYQQSGVGGTWFIENTGGGQAHNNLPPYLVVYIWKRVEPEPETPIEEEITEEN